MSSSVPFFFAGVSTARARREEWAVLGAESVACVLVLARDSAGYTSETKSAYEETERKRGWKKGLTVLLVDDGGVTSILGEGNANANAVVIVARNVMYSRR